MCGIVGYIGTREAFPILISGLKRLEYRGYDSAGIALINEADEMMVYKEKGKVSNLEERTLHHDTSGTIGIAHTRWATHGEPNSVNAHPHFSASGNLAIIHNAVDISHDHLTVDRLHDIPVAGPGIRKDPAVINIHIGIGNITDGDDSL